MDDNNKKRVLLLIHNPYVSRLNRLMSYMEEQKIDVAMVTSPTNIYYFTGFFSNPNERFMSLVIDSRAADISLYVPSLEFTHASEASAVPTVIPVSDTDNPYELLQAYLGVQVLSLGVEKKVLTLFQSEKLMECFPKVRYISIEEYITSLRLKKSPEDIQNVRRAVAVVEKVLQYGVSKVALGITELELTAELEYMMKVSGADRPAFSSIVLSGPNSSLPHGIPGHRKIEQGDLLLFDLGVYIDGYCSDISRTFVMGQESAEQKRIYEIVREANQRAIAAVIMGEPIGVVDRTARDFIDSQGYGQFFTHRVGHGLGLDVHEAPSIHSQNETLMQPGLLFTVEPGIYIPGVGGIRIEDDIYIGEDGTVEVLTSYPKHLIQL